MCAKIKKNNSGAKRLNRLVQLRISSFTVVLFFFWNRHWLRICDRPLARAAPTHNKGTRNKTQKCDYIYVLRQIRTHDLGFPTIKDKPLLRPRDHWHQSLRNLIHKISPTTQNRRIPSTCDSNRTSAKFKPSSSLCSFGSSGHTQRSHNYGFENPWSRHVISGFITTFVKTRTDFMPCCKKQLKLAFLPYHHNSSHKQYECAQNKGTTAP